MKEKSNDQPVSTVLATDLDGTFIPLDGNDQHRRDMRILVGLLVARNTQLVYVTGRHLESVMQGMTDFELPQPDWMICDVGTSLLKAQQSGEYLLIDQYQQHQADIISDMPINSLKEQLSLIDGLRCQEEEKQSQFKMSYYVDAKRLGEVAGQRAAIPG